MAEANPSGPSPHDAAVAEFDLREGVLILAAWWREILALTVLFAILGTILYAVTLEYEATADVVVLRAQPSVVFDDKRFRTLPQQGRQPATELLAGRDTLFGLASSGAVALAASDRLNEEAADFRWQPADLLKAVDAELVASRESRNTRGQTSAMVRITARADSPSDAGSVANAWAEAYVNLVNTLFAPDSARQLDSITGELAEAQHAYDTAQQELEAFMAANEARAVRQDIRAKVAVLEGHFDSQILSLNENRATRQRLGRILAAVQGMRTQVDAGGEAGLVSNTPAIQLLKVEAFVMAAKLTPRVASSSQTMLSGAANSGGGRGRFDGLPPVLLDFSDSSGLTLDVNFGGAHVDVRGQQADLEALDQSLQSWLAALDQTIAAQGANLLKIGFSGLFPPVVHAQSSGQTPVGDALGHATIEGHYQGIRSLEARLEALVTQEAQLTSQRDRLFTTLDVLRNKEAEFRLAAAVSQPELRLASPAVEPPHLPAIGAHILPSTMISTVVGLTLGILAAFLANLLGKGPFLFTTAIAPR